LQFSSLIELLLDRRDDVEVDGDGWPPQALSRRHVLGFFRCFIGTSPSGILDSSVSPQRIAPMSRAFGARRRRHQGGGPAWAWDGGGVGVRIRVFMD